MMSSLQAASFLFAFLLCFSFVTAVGIDNPDIPIIKTDPATFDNATAYINNSVYLRGYSPTGLRDLFQTTYDTIYCKLTGCTMTGDIDMGGNDITNVGDITADNLNATSSIGSSVLRWLKGWFVNLDVENNIIVGGDLNVSGYVNGKNYVTQYHRNAIIDTTSVNIWVNVTWDLTIDEETTSGYSLNDSNTSITIENDGIYRVQGCLHPKNNGVGNQEANLYSRILIDDVEAKCLQFANSKEFKTTGIDTMPFTGTLYAEAGQKVQLQYYVTNLDIDFEGDTVFDDAVAASLNFERLSN